MTPAASYLLYRNMLSREQLTLVMAADAIVIMLFRLLAQQ